jgi:hypothetical protein
MMKQASAAAASVPVVQLLAGIALATIVYMAVGRPVGYYHVCRQLRFFHHRDVDVDVTLEKGHQRQRTNAARVGGGGKCV